MHHIATMVLQFWRGGDVATLELSWYASYGYDQRCEISGDAGAVLVQNEHAYVAKVANRGGFCRPSIMHSFPEQSLGVFIAEMDFFADVMAGGRTWPIAEADCMAVRRITGAEKESCNSGTAVRLA